MKRKTIIVWVVVVGVAVLVLQLLRPSSDPTTAQSETDSTSEELGAPTPTPAAEEENKQLSSLVEIVAVFESGYWSLYQDDNFLARRERVAEMVDPEVLPRLDFRIIESNALSAIRAEGIEIVATVDATRIQVEEPDDGLITVASPIVTSKVLDGETISVDPEWWHTTYWRTSDNGWLLVNMSK